MNLGRCKSLLLVTLLLLVTSVAGWSQVPCGVANEIYCQPWDGLGAAYASQNDTGNGFGKFATVYDNFTLSQTWDVQSFHWVGGYFNGPPTTGTITGWTLTFYYDSTGQPGSAFAQGFFPGNGGETCITSDCSIDPVYVYWLYFGGLQLTPGTYWASVVPDLGFPPQWGWESGTGGDSRPTRTSSALAASWTLTWPLQSTACL